MSDLFIVAGVILVAFVAHWHGYARGYRAGHRDGWKQFADKLQEERTAARALRVPPHVLGRYSPPEEPRR